MQMIASAFSTSQGGGVERDGRENVGEAGSVDPCSNAAAGRFVWVRRKKVELRKALREINHVLAGAARDFKRQTTLRQYAAQHLQDGIAIACD